MPKAVSPFFMTVTVLLSMPGAPIKALCVASIDAQTEGELVGIQRKAMDAAQDVLLPETTENHDEHGKFVEAPRPKSPGAKSPGAKSPGAKSPGAKITLISDVWGPTVNGRIYYNRQQLLDGHYPDHRDAATIRNALVGALVSQGWV